MAYCQVEEKNLEGGKQRGLGKRGRGRGKEGRKLVRRERRKEEERVKNHCGGLKGQKREISRRGLEQLGQLLKNK